MEIYLAKKITFDSIVDGPGLRSVIWFQGCTHNCPGCHNPQTHDFGAGFEEETDNIINQIINQDMQSGVTFSGGDPLMQIKACIEIAKELKKHNINIWCYTGFVYEELLKNKNAKMFFQYIDVLVDGPYIKSLSNYDLNFKGSSNQRIIDIQKSLKENKIILFEKE